jgi:hypothetical protein
VFFTLPSEPLQYLGDGVEPAANLSRRVEVVGTLVTRRQNKPKK